MNTIVISEERLEAEPLLVPCLQAFFPGCRIVITSPEEGRTESVGAPKGASTRDGKKGAPGSP